MHILVINAGSSSLKWQLFQNELLLRDELIERWDPATGFDDIVGAVADGPTIDAVGHRVVHGGPLLRDPTVITDDVVRYLETTIDLAPLHQPPALAGIAAAREAFPDATHIACFDTGFHKTIGAAAATYAIPAEWNERWQLRRYGFHGLSHGYAFAAGADLAGISRYSRILTAHLGSGASLCAVRGAQSVDTTMGFTPLEGLVMATRSGSVDPGLVLWLLQHTELSVDEVLNGLEHSAGLAGLSGTGGDLRDVLAEIQGGSPDAQLAWEVFNHRLLTLSGQMIASMGGLDLIVFTGGIGEHRPLVRTALGSGLDFLGVVIDEAANNAVDGDAVISAADSKVAVVVVAAREDLQIVRNMRELLGT